MTPSIMSIPALLCEIVIRENVSSMASSSVCCWECNLLENGYNRVVTFLAFDT